MKYIKPFELFETANAPIQTKANINTKLTVLDINDNEIETIVIDVIENNPKSPNKHKIKVKDITSKNVYWAKYDDGIDGYKIK